MTTAVLATLAPAGAATLDPPLLELPTVEVAPLLVEVHPNPVGSDPGREWFELSNPAPVDLALDGWAVTDNDPCFAKGFGYVENYTLALDGLVIPAGGRLVVTIPDVGGCLRLANTGDDLTLLAPNATAVQSVAWGPGQDVAAPKEGRSVAACLEADAIHGAWQEQAATPGEANAACSA